MHVGQRIQSLMKAKGISTDQMADHCGITAGAVSNWFATGRIAKGNLAKAAELLGVRERQLITGEEDDPFLGALESEWSRRIVPDAIREAILTMIKSSPLKTYDPQPHTPPPMAADETKDEHTYNKALQPPGADNAHSMTKRKGR